MTRKFSARRFTFALLLTWWLCAPALADEPIVTVLADFEDDSVAANIAQVSNISPADCAARLAAIPARGTKSLAIDIGATAPDVTVVSDLVFRVATRFDRADRIAIFCYVNGGVVTAAIRLRDANGRLFECPPTQCGDPNRWVRLVADLAAAQPVETAKRQEQASGVDPASQPTSTNADAPPMRWPVEVVGLRVRTPRLGKQTVFFDDLEVEHLVAPGRVVRADFRLDHPTRTYEPGEVVKLGLLLENASRQRAVRAAVELSWTRPDGSVLKTQQDSANLPASGVEFRSRQTLDFSQRVDEPGLYRLSARAAVDRNLETFESSVAVMPTNRNLPRGRDRFFGVRINLLRESLGDQLLEMEAAAEIGVQLVAIETPWRLLEPRAGAPDFERLDRLFTSTGARDFARMIVLTEPPDWTPRDAAGVEPALSALLTALARHFGEKVRFYQPAFLGERIPDAAERAAIATKALAALNAVVPTAQLVLPSLDIDYATRHAPPTTDEKSPQSSFVFDGAPLAAMDAWRSLAERTKRAWGPGDWWELVAAPLDGPGSLDDAIQVLRMYVRAAESGVSGVVWFDLRDDGNDPLILDSQRGLLRRDFSPKTTLLGYATAAGMLGGLRYEGPVAGAPPEYESALFIGRDRQVAVLIPRLNRTLPAVLAPLQGVPGELTAQDFGRRKLPMLAAGAPPLLISSPRPQFVTLALPSAQPAAQIALAAPWIVAPARVLVAQDAAIAVEIRALAALRKSYVQLVLPKDSPLGSTFSTRAIQAPAGDSVKLDIPLKPKGDPLSDWAEVVLRVNIEGKAIEVPIRAERMTVVRRVADEKSLTRIGDLIPPDPDRDARRVRVACSRSSGELALLVTPPTALKPPDRLALALAAENDDVRRAIQIDANGKIAPAVQTTAQDLSGWRAEITPAGAISIYVPLQPLEVGRANTPPRIHVALRVQLERTAFEFGTAGEASEWIQRGQWIELAGN
ncbi:MAG: hypothetical protein U1D55_01645 [Phycisphaerae bacterium]